MSRPPDCSETAGFHQLLLELSEEGYSSSYLAEAIEACRPLSGKGLSRRRDAMALAVSRSFGRCSGSNGTTAARQSAVQPESSAVAIHRRVG